MSAWQTGPPSLECKDPAPGRPQKEGAPFVPSPWCSFAQVGEHGRRAALLGVLSTHHLPTSCKAPCFTLVLGPQPRSEIPEGPARACRDSCRRRQHSTGLRQLLLCAKQTVTGQTWVWTAEKVLSQGTRSEFTRTLQRVVMWLGNQQRNEEATGCRWSGLRPCYPAVGTATRAAATHTARVAVRAQKRGRGVPGPAAMATTQYRATLSAVMRKTLA